MNSISKWTSICLVAGLFAQLPAQAQSESEQVRIKIDANVDGQQLHIDTTIEQMEDFDLNAFLQDLGISDASGDVHTLDIRIMESDQAVVNMDWLDDNEAWKDMRIKIENIDIPELPDLPPMANMMFFNGNKVFLGVVTENTDDRNGVVVQKIIENSAAAAAGLEKGDIITMVGNKTVESSNNLVEILSAFEPGDEVSITYLRNGNELVRSVVLKENESYFESKEWEDYGAKWEEWGSSFEDHMQEWSEQYSEDQVHMEEKAFLGVYLQNLDEGVEITGISEGSGAEAAGLMKGDIITSIDEMPMETHQAVSDYIRSKKAADVVQVNILREGSAMTVPATLQMKKTEMLFWKDDEEGFMPFHGNEFYLFSPKSGNCNAYSYERNDGDGKKVTIHIEIIGEEEGVETNERTPSPESNPLTPSDIQFFPNPNNGTFSLQFKVDASADMLIQIRDINGAMVYEEDLPGFSGNYDKTITLGNEAKGTYFVNIVHGEYIVTKQIVVQ